MKWSDMASTVFPLSRRTGGRSCPGRSSTAVTSWNVASVLRAGSSPCASKVPTCVRCARRRRFCCQHVRHSRNSTRFPRIIPEVGVIAPQAHRNVACSAASGLEVSARRVLRYELAATRGSSATIARTAVSLLSIICTVSDRVFESRSAVPRVSCLRSLSDRPLRSANLTRSLV